MEKGKKDKKKGKNNGKNHNDKKKKKKKAFSLGFLTLATHLGPSEVCSSNYHIYMSNTPPQI